MGAVTQNANKSMEKFNAEFGPKFKGNSSLAKHFVSVVGVVIAEKASSTIAPSSYSTLPKVFFFFFFFWLGFIFLDFEGLKFLTLRPCVWSADTNKPFAILALLTWSDK
jgi:hypothetical protein